MTRFSAALALFLLSIASTAEATFPPGPIDCNIFDFDNENFVGHNFAFATNLTHSEAGQDAVSTGFNGFVASPEQVSQVPDFVSDTDLLVNFQNLSDLFDITAPLPDSVREGFISQNISGVGELSNTFSFSSVTVNQSSFFDVSQDSGSFSNLRGEGKAYFPFEAFSTDGGPVDIDLVIDLFSFFNFTGSGFVSESLFVGLIDITDPDNPFLMDAVEGFYFADRTEITPQFTRGVDGENDISDSFFFGSQDGDLLGSLFYQIETQLQSGNTYAVGIIGDASAGLDGEGSAVIDSSNTLSVSIDVVSDGGALVLPGFVVPEPATAASILVVLIGLAACRR